MVLSDRVVKLMAKDRRSFVSRAGAIVRVGQDGEPSIFAAKMTTAARRRKRGPQQPWRREHSRDDREAQLVALRDEEHAALQALAMEWTARRQSGFAAVKKKATRRRFR